MLAIQCLTGTRCRSDLAIARTESGRKMRIGEGSTGVVYKALMHGCDEVAVKIVRAAHPTQKELELFQREVSFMLMIRIMVSLLASMIKASTMAAGPEQAAHPT